MGQFVFPAPSTVQAGKGDGVSWNSAELKDLL